MKKSLLLATIIFCSSYIFAQDQLLVQSSDKGLYLEHTVVPKESFYSIGRLFNLPPKDIAAFNGLDMNKGLNIDQVIKIPLKSGNFSQSNDHGRAIYYQVQPKDGLYRVSLKNNKVLMANLRKWNHLSSDNIAAGQKLIVGYLVSPQANNIVAAPLQEKPGPVLEESKNELAIQQDAEPKKEEVQKKQEVEKQIDPPVTRPVLADPSPSVTMTEGGYFKSQFEQQEKTKPARISETASAGIFKTASGWQDAKYYALIDGVEPGTIIRIINPTNNKIIYAKVLGEMSGIRQNQGYDVRISNSAASAMGVTDTDKFIVRVNR